MKTYINENEARKLVLDLLKNYGDAHVINIMYNDHDYFKPVFIEHFCFHTICIRTAKSFSKRRILLGRTIARIAHFIWKTLKDGGSLESELKNGDYVIIKLGTESGAVEKFLLEYELKNAVK